MEDADVIIVGQGIAGTAIAWQLHWLGQRVVLIDRVEPDTSSRVAAGIINPITGQRVALSWRVEEFYRTAIPFYRRTEAELGGTFLTILPHVRLLQNDDEHARFERKRTDPAFARWLSSPQPSPLVNAAWFRTDDPGFEMTGGAWLDVKAWLDASAAFFRSRGMLLQGEVPEASVTWLPDSAELSTPSLLRTRRVIWCTGQAAARSTLFPWLRWRSARGDILTIHAPGLGESRMVVRGGWLLPLGKDSLFRAGSTYDWNRLVPEPSAAGRTEIESRLQTLLRIPWHTEDHRAGVRPIINESKAVIGLHPARPACGFFNGLGSKGVLHAPFFSAMLAQHLCSGSEIETALDLAKNG